MEIFRVNYISFSSFLSIETLIKSSYFTDDPLLISEPLRAVQSDKAKLRNTSFEKKVGKVRISILCFMKIIRTKLENTALN